MAKRSRKSRGPKRRHWCGTENNPGEDSLFLRLETESTLPEGVTYVAFQEEKGEKNATPHYQVYVELVTGQFMSWLKKNISYTAHWEPRMGTAVQASLYCTKDDTRSRGPWIIGSISKGAGSRTDLVDFRDAIMSGKRKRDLWQSHPVQMAKYRHMYADINSLSMPSRTTELRVVLLIGLTRTGKTRTVWDNWEKLEGQFWTMPMGGSTIWFDGLDQHKRVLMDDFAGRMSKMPLLMLLWLTDRYPRYVQIKSSFTWWLPDMVAITSNYHPRKWYDWKKREESYDALCARFHEVMIFSKEEGRKDLDEDEMEEYWKQRFDEDEFCLHKQCRLYDTCQVTK